MSSYIDVDLIVYDHAVARSLDDGHNWNELVACKDQIDDIPTADVVEVVRGKWIRDVDYDYPCICNKCGYQFAYKGAVIRCDDIFHFCPNCGADMRGKENVRITD